MAHPHTIEVLPLDSNSSNDLDLSLTSDLLRSTATSPSRAPASNMARNEEIINEEEANQQENDRQDQPDGHEDISSGVSQYPVISHAPPRLPPISNVVHPAPQGNNGTEKQEHSSQDNREKNIADLLAMLECPVCMDTADRPPIYQCPEGHLLCEDCNSRMMDCPQCGHALMNSRNRTAEELAAKLQALQGNRQTSTIPPSQALKISVSAPRKVRKGLFSHVEYQFNSQVAQSGGQEDDQTSTYKVTRQYSDIVNLYERLIQDHGSSGVIVPPPPEKNRLASLAVGMSRNSDLESSIASQVFEKKCVALDRYFKRLAKHPVIRKDPNFRDFIQKKSLSKRLKVKKSFGETITDLKAKLNLYKTKFTVTEHDPWFQTRHAQLTMFSKQLQEMQDNLRDMAHIKSKLSKKTIDFQRGLLAMLVSRPSKDNNLGQIINEVVDCHKTMGVIHQEQSQADELIVQLALDYGKLVVSAKETMSLRRKYQEEMQRAQKAKNSLEEIEKIQKEFDKLSQTIRRELEHFDFVMRTEFEEAFNAYSSSYWSSLSKTKRETQNLEGF